MTAALQQWLDQNKAAPETWREIARRLLAYHDASALFAPFAKLDIDQVRVFSAVLTAAKYAAQELNRPKRTVEAKSLARVERAVAGLRQAIQVMPKSEWTLFDIEGADLPVVNLRVGWREVADTPGSSALGYPLSVAEVLDIADELLLQMRQQLPVRALTRHRDRPRERSFVQWLEYVLRDRFSRRIRAGALAHIANAAMALGAEQELDDQMVREFLRDSPLKSRVKRKRPAR